jgi:ketosteroid isomerase-like protein
LRRTTGGQVQPVRIDRAARADTLACFVEVERLRVKVGGGTEYVDVSVTTTSVFRREHGGWKLVHRHADPITTPRPAESVISR